MRRPRKPALSNAQIARLVPLLEAKERRGLVSSAIEKATSRLHEDGFCFVNEIVSATRQTLDEAGLLPEWRLMIAEAARG